MTNINSNHDLYKVISITKLFSPYETDIDLIRVGGNNDGGYLIPNDLDGIRSCLSPGVSTYATFEEDLLNRFGIQSHLIDYSVEAPPGNFSPATFTKKYLGSFNNDQYITMTDWIKNIGIDNDSELLLQIDIEGSEYETLIATDDSTLNRFRIIVIEIHWMLNYFDSAFNRMAMAMAKKLTLNHFPVHLHTNNYANIIEINGIQIPDVIEVTFLRKDRGLPKRRAELPHPLDRPCNPNKEEHPVPNIFLL